MPPHKNVQSNDSVQRCSKELRRTLLRQEAQIFGYEHLLLQKQEVIHVLQRRADTLSEELKVKDKTIAYLQRSHNLLVKKDKSDPRTEQSLVSSQSSISPALSSVSSPCSPPLKKIDIKQGSAKKIPLALRKLRPFLSDPQPSKRQKARTYKAASSSLVTSRKRQFSSAIGPVCIQFDYNEKELQKLVEAARRVDESIDHAEMQVSSESVECVPVLVKSLHYTESMHSAVWKVVWLDGSDTYQSAEGLMHLECFHYAVTRKLFPLIFSTGGDQNSFLKHLRKFNKSSFFNQ